MLAYTPKKLSFDGKDYINRWLYAHTPFGNYQITMEYPWRCKTPTNRDTTYLFDTKEEMLKYAQQHYNELFAQAGDTVII